MDKKKYTPVDEEFYEIIHNLKTKPGKLKIHYFDAENDWKTKKGNFHSITKKPQGDFMKFKDETEIRLDRIITVNGKIGPAHDEFDAYANECMDCSGGYDL